MPAWQKVLTSKTGGPLQVASVIGTLLAATTAAAARAAIGALSSAGDSLTGALGINRGGGAINATEIHGGAGSYTIDGNVSVRLEPVIAAPGNYPRTLWFRPSLTGNTGQNFIGVQIVPELTAGKTCPAMYGLGITHINAAAATKFVGLWVYNAGGTAPTTNYDAILNGGGNVGIGTDTPTALLHVAGTVKLGTSGTVLTQVRVYTPTLTPAEIANDTTVEQSYTVTGLTTADTVLVTGPSPTAGTALGNARVSASDTLVLTWVNVTGGARTPTAGTYRVLAIRT